MGGPDTLRQVASKLPKAEAALAKGQSAAGIVGSRVAGMDVKTLAQADAGARGSPRPNGIRQMEGQDRAPTGGPSSILAMPRRTVAEPRAGRSPTADQASGRSGRGDIVGRTCRRGAVTQAAGRLGGPGGVGLPDVGPAPALSGATVLVRWTTAVTPQSSELRGWLSTWRGTAAVGSLPCRQVWGLGAQLQAGVASGGRSVPSGADRATQGEAACG